MSVWRTLIHDIERLEGKTVDTNQLAADYRAAQDFENGKVDAHRPKLDAVQAAQQALDQAKADAAATQADLDQAHADTEAKREALLTAALNGVERRSI